MVPKSGCPVFGQTLVNSGQTISMLNSRPGRGLGNVSSCSTDGVSVGSMSRFSCCGSLYLDSSCRVGQGFAQAHHLLQSAVSLRKALSHPTKTTASVCSL